MGIVRSGFSALSNLARSTKGQGLLAVVLTFVVSRVIYLGYFDVRFSDEPLDSYVQFVDPVLLKSRLVESIYYLTDQPPLFNLYLGVILKGFPGHSREAFAATFLGCGFVLAVSLYLLLTRVGVPPAWSAVLAGAYTANPATILYENWLFYTYPLAMLTCVSALFLHRYLTERRPLDGLLAVGLVGALVLTRALFHPLWMLLVVAALVLVVRGKRRQVVLVSLLPLALTFSVFVKNYFVFGNLFAGKRNLGVTLAHVSTAQLPLAEREKLIQEGKLSPLARVAGFYGVRPYAPYLPPFKKTGIALLDQEVKTNGTENGFHSAGEEIGELLYRDALYVIKNYPELYWYCLWANVKEYFQPAGDHHFDGCEVANLERLAPLLHASGLQTTGFDWIVFPACLVYAVFFGGRWLVRRFRPRPAGAPAARHADATGFTVLYGLLGIVVVSALTIAISPNDHNRYRVAVTPFYFVLFGMLTWDTYGWCLARLSRRWAPEHPPPGLVRWLAAGLVLVVGLDAMAGLLRHHEYERPYHGQPVRYWSAHPEAEEAAPALAEALTDPSPEVRWKSALMLGALVPDSRGAAPALVGALSDPDARVRQAAAGSLGRIGADARAAVPALAAALKDADPGVGKMAAVALGQIGPEAREAISALHDALNHEDANVGQAAAWALSRVLGKDNPGPRAGVPALAVALKDPEPATRVEAAWALWRLGPRAKGAVPALAAALQDADAGVALAAAFALGAVGPEAAAAVPALVAALKSPDENLRQRTVVTLGEIGPAAVEALPALRGLLGAADPTTRDGVAAAVAQIDIPITELAARLRDTDPEVRRRTADLLTSLAPKAEGAVPALAATLADPNPEIRLTAVSALAALGPNAAAAIPNLADALQDRDERVSITAAGALGGMGPAAKVAVPALVAALRQENASVRRAAALALGSIGPAAEPAAPALRELRTDPDQAVRDQAAAALIKMGVK